MREGGQGGSCCGDPKAPRGPEAGLGQPALTIHPDDPGQVPTSDFPPYPCDDTARSTRVSAGNPGPQSVGVRLVG